MNIETALERVRTGPRGPETAAFFDFDGTIVHGFSGLHFFRDRLLSGNVGATELAATMLNGLRGTETEDDFERFAGTVFKAWRGHTEDELYDLGQRLFMSTIAGHLYPEAWQLVGAHQNAGHTVVIASSASRYQIQACSDALGIEHVLYTPLEVRDGVLTGRVDGRSLWRSGKAQAARAFMDAHGIDSETSYSYSNGGEDADFLAATAHPTATNPDRTLHRIALERGWPVLRFRPRGTPGAKEFVRTAAAYGGLFGSVWAGLGLGLLNGSRKIALDSILNLGSEVSLALAGIDVRVVGQANAWSARPAVFLFNHQSQLDPLVLAKVLRHDFTGVAKQEMARDPFFGPLLRFGGVTFVDRNNTERALAALGPVVETLRNGTSLVIAPEGTRSLTPAIGTFKKGAFRIAMAAGVPVVPIVIRNSGEMLWKHSTLLRSGTVDVAVLDPIDVGDWSPDELGDRIAEVEDLYRNTLGRWPVAR
ncbi:MULTISPECIES: HAD-IB family hydrolase [unclassified Rhodococcus (in: high G+C Gram-positive bacteria)]|uniref:HAD-IB family hydrolase n=1 Tax=unclassified Rhodococcus (in: high G+C Gram-positive bacteria) TaxID=192944 RepID=UPI00146D066E|nr:HAD-IB family hydrolase [Rhodococcus sp. 105337]